MHSKLIKDASEQQIREFATDALTMIKETNRDLYDKLEMYLYKEIYGCHFNEWMLNEATNKFINEDGTTGPHWSVEQTTSVANQYGIKFDNFNEYDWNYVMNMMYSDYYGAVSNDVSSYAKMAKKFLEDKDARKGKAFYYYISLRND